MGGKEGVSLSVSQKIRLNEFENFVATFWNGLGMI